GPPAALDGAVHVALPAEARVFAGEEQTPERAGEPLSQRGIEPGIEIRVTAARPRIRFPNELARPDELRGRGPEPVDGAGAAGHALPLDDRLRRIACRPAGHQRDDAGAAALFLVAVPHSTESQVAAEGARTADRAPESARELKQCFRHPPVAEPRD